MAPFGLPGPATLAGVIGCASACACACICPLAPPGRPGHPPKPVVAARAEGQLMLRRTGGGGRLAIHTLVARSPKWPPSWRPFQDSLSRRHGGATGVLFRAFLTR